MSTQRALSSFGEGGSVFKGTRSDVAMLASGALSKVVSSTWEPSFTTKAGGLARLRWDSVEGADAYVVLRDSREIAGPLRIEGSQKEWTDKVRP